LLEDPVLGPPKVLLRRLGSSVLERVSYVELGEGDDPDQRLYFERDQSSQQSVVVPGPGAPTDELPLNLFSDETSHVAFLLAFDQPLNPSRSNLSNRFVQLEYQVPGGGGAWVPIQTSVELLSNCISMGTSLRLKPAGILPAASRVRAVLRAGLQGFGGVSDASMLDQNQFAVAQTRALDYSSLSEPGAGADELFESFDVGGSGRDSREDDGSGSVVPLASWGGGRLESLTNFQGGGGPGGSFDWIVRGNPEGFDTSSQIIVGGPGGTQALQQFTLGGVVDVHDFIILPNAMLRVIGPNPFIVNATGEIRIEGTLDISGVAGKDVATLNTGSQPEIGGAGVCGGGGGGGTSEVRGNSTPRGGRGESPFGVGLGGGEGGESGYSTIGNLSSNRRAGGGGGGRFNTDQSDLDATSVTGSDSTKGMAAGVGGAGHDNAAGAVTGILPAPGGLPGSGPFQDADARNNFFGARADVVSSVLVDGSAPVIVSQGGLIPGELIGIHAGYGGGGGGDSIRGPGFPTPNWTVSSDEKGGGGGGGAGALRLRALGPIRFVGFNSLILCKGAVGGFGETRLGGYGGSGSGGHVILESATNIRFELPPVVDRADDMRRHVFIDARGVKGKQRTPEGISDGGEGGPGVIQLHVPDAVSPPHEDAKLTDLVLPVGTLEELTAGDSEVLLEVMRPAGVQALPSFGARSGARSRWLDLRTAGVGADGKRGLLAFLFAGVDPVTGLVQTQNERIQPLAPLLSGKVQGGDVRFEGSDALVLSGVALQPLLAAATPVAGDLYLRTPALLRNFTLRMTPAIGTSLDFIVQDSFFDEAAQSLCLQVSQLSGIDLGELAQPGSSPSYALLPRFFSVSTGGVEGLLPTGNSVQILFEGAQEDSGGAPDPSLISIGESADASLFSALPPGQLDFIRFRVEFNLDTQGSGLSPTAAPVALEFLRLPFVYLPMS